GEIMTRDTHRILTLASMSLIACILCNVEWTYAKEEVRHLYPIDQAVRDPSFLTFRTSLMSAVLHRDTPFLLKIVEPSIVNSFGGAGGKMNFRKNGRWTSQIVQFGRR